MKIAQVIRAYDLISERRDLIDHLAGKHGGLSAASRHCDAEMMAALAVPYEARLRSRIVAMEQELIGMGVDLNEPTATATAPSA